MEDRLQETMAFPMLFHIQGVYPESNEAFPGNGGEAGFPLPLS